MDEQKLIKLLKQHFPSKKDYGSLRRDFEDFRDFVSKNVATKKDLKNFATKKDLESFVTKTKFDEFGYEMRSFRKETTSEFKIINEKLDELKSSANSLDQILIQHPIERIIRLEKHSKLSPFAPAVSVE